MAHPYPYKENGLSHSAKTGTRQENAPGRTILRRKLGKPTVQPSQPSLDMQQNDETEVEGYYLNDQGFYRDVDKESILVHWSRAGKKYLRDGWNREGLLEHVLYTSRVTPDTTNNVPKNLRQTSPK